MIGLRHTYLRISSLEFKALMENLLIKIALEVLLKISQIVLLVFFYHYSIIILVSEFEMLKLSLQQILSSPENSRPYHNKIILMSLYF